VGRQKKTFTAVIALTLALGIGANVAIYSLVEQALLRPLPVPEPDRLVNLNDPAPKTLGWRMDAVRLPAVQRETDSGGPYNVFSYPMFRDLERAQEPFVGLAAHQTLDGVTLSTGDQARPGRAIAVSGSYFSVLGLRPALGRLLGPEDDGVDGQAESVVLSHAYWQSAFAGDRNVLGRTLLVDDLRLTIVGVAPSGFNGTMALSPVWAIPVVFVPITIPGDAPPDDFAIPNHARRDSYWVHLFARLKPGVTREQASASLNPLFRGILSEVEAPLLFDVSVEEREAFRTRALVLEPGARGQTNNEALFGIRIGLFGLLMLSGLVLLLCCANVAGLMLVRATARTGEMAVRASMGASRGRLASLLAAESLVLALPAALMSLPIALLILRGPSRVPGIPDEAVVAVLELVSNVSLSATAALVAIGAAVVSALAVGLLPLRGLIRTEPGKTLQAYGARQTTAKGVTRFRAGLATAQVALSMALLAITGALANGIANLTRIDLGVELGSIATFDITRPGNTFRLDDPAMGRVAEAVEGIPGVSAVASSFPAPLLDRETSYFPVSVQGVEAEPLPVAGYVVAGDFFRLFGLELLAGRALNDTDSVWSVAVVSQRFAERFGLTHDDVLGRTVDLGRGFGTSVIVGVVADFKSGRIAEEIEPRMYLPGWGGTFYVSSAVPPESLLNPIRDTVARVDPSMGIAGFQTIEQQFLDGIAIERFAAGAASAFAVLATALAALGLYGVLAYSVAQRSREIGLRFALGAPAGRIRGMVLKQVARMAAIGVVLGAIAAWALGRAAQSVLLGIDAGDPLALVAAAALLIVVMLGAAYLPARRASRVAPMSVLRDE
jgi:predicted permease